MSNIKFKHGGPSFIGDLVRQGGSVSSNITSDELLIETGAGPWQDYAKNGGNVVDNLPDNLVFDGDQLTFDGDDMTIVF